MRKQLRLKVYQKYGGRCAYCGNKIEYENMQVDHLFPKIRGHFYQSENMKSIYNLMGESIDDFSNLMPSCRRCNHYKRAELLEVFRKQMLTLHERIMANYINKVGVDYGIITIKPFDGDFYFEKVQAVL